MSFNSAGAAADALRADALRSDQAAGARRSADRATADRVRDDRDFADYLARNDRAAEEARAQRDRPARDAAASAPSARRADAATKDASVDRGDGATDAASQPDARAAATRPEQDRAVKPGAQSPERPGKDATEPADKSDESLQQSKDDGATTAATPTAEPQLVPDNAGAAVQQALAAGAGTGAGAAPLAADANGGGVDPSLALGGKPTAGMQHGVGGPAEPTLPGDETSPAEAGAQGEATASAGNASAKAAGVAPSKAAAAGTGEIAKTAEKSAGADAALQAPTPTALAGGQSPDLSASAPDTAPATPTLAASGGDPARTADAAQAAPQQAASAAAAGDVAMQVRSSFVERFDGRAQRFDISLTPVELGRVEVRIEIGADKRVHAMLSAHDPAALQELQRGHRALEQSLRDAGVDVADNGLSFELRQDNGQSAKGEPAPWDRRGMANAFAVRAENARLGDGPLAAAAVSPGRRLGVGRLDLIA